jgi:hypothetical protein
MAGTHSATSTCGYCFDASAIALISAISAERPFIFQLPAMSFFSGIPLPCCSTGH